MASLRVTARESVDISCQYHNSKMILKTKTEDNAQRNNFNIKMRLSGFICLQRIQTFEREKASNTNILLFAYIK